MTKRTKRVEELLRAALAAQHSGHKEPSAAVGEKDGIPMEERKTETIAEEPEKEREEDTPGTSSRRILEDGEVVCSSPVADSLGSTPALERRPS